MTGSTPLSGREDLGRLLARLTLEEKSSLLSGDGFWSTTPIVRGDEVLVRSLWLSDGPNGLRKQSVPVADGRHAARTGEDGRPHPEGGTASAWPATCFPTATTLASSWDLDLVREVGAALGREARAAGVGLVLGPGANIKRDPRCGRSFEYFTEDPLLSGDLAAAMIEGLQSAGVGATVKHLAANNQETDRMRVSAEIDERTLREIYLASFERAVTRGRPWAVMSAYNRINGVHASHSRWLLTDVLRTEWGWDGVVLSDWGAVWDPVLAVSAGLDLTMPSADGLPDADLAAAVRSGRLEESLVDAAASNVLALVARSDEAAGHGTRPHGTAADDVDHAAHRSLARRAAAAGAVLLRNEPVPGDDGAPAPLLPLTLEVGTAFIGELARTPRYQGAGSAQVNPTRLVSPLDAARELLGAPVAFAPGFAIEEGPEPTGDLRELRDEAVELARTSRTVVLYLGLPLAVESEGYDRRSIELPADQVALLRAVTAVNPRVVVVLANGGVVTTSGWDENVPALLEAWLGGQEGAAGVLDVLTGAVNPSGKLAETIPVRMEDVPSFGNFPGSLGTVRYGEGLLVGYRWYDTRRLDVSYPFGFGLSYTTFAVEDVAATVSGTGDDVVVTVSVQVTNTGGRAGAEVVQVYVTDSECTLERPEQELKAYQRVELQPGESRRVTLTLDRRSFAFWHPPAHRWTVEAGEFILSVGTSSRDIHAEIAVELDGDDLTEPLSLGSTVAELLAHPVVGNEVARVLAGALGDHLRGVPLDLLVRLRMVPLDRAAAEELVARANAAHAATRPTSRTRPTSATQADSRSTTS